MMIVMTVSSHTDFTAIVRSAASPREGLVTYRGAACTARWCTRSGCRSSAGSCGPAIHCPRRTSSSPISRSAAPCCARPSASSRPRGLWKRGRRPAPACVAEDWNILDRTSSAGASRPRTTTAAVRGSDGDATRNRAARRAAGGNSKRYEEIAVIADAFAGMEAGVGDQAAYSLRISSSTIGSSPRVTTSLLGHLGGILHGVLGRRSAHDQSEALAREGASAPTGRLSTGSRPVTRHGPRRRPGLWIADSAADIKRLTRTTRLADLTRHRPRRLRSARERARRSGRAGRVHRGPGGTVFPAKPSQ